MTDARTSLRRSAPASPRTWAAVRAGRLAGALSRAAGRGRGSALPGKVALRVAPDLLARLTRDRVVLVVSGTNGKTTTTRYLAAALGTRGPVETNSDGSNMQGGLVTALMRDADPQVPVVLEVDEKVLAVSAGQLQPTVVALLNLSRDQLDRAGEVSSHVPAWAAALRAAPGATVVANADDPLVCAAVLLARPDGHGVRWVAAGQPWRHDTPLCPVCGRAWDAAADDWACAACGFARPAAAWSVSADGVLTAPGSAPVRLALALPGRANEANAAMAAAAAAVLGVAPEVGTVAMSGVADVDGRYLAAQVGAAQVRLLLAKNPAGWAEVLAQLADQQGAVVVAVNARDADGTDPSWLWDVPFERLQGRTVVAAGERSADISLRLRYADVPHTRSADPLAALAALPAGPAWVVGNYTAFTTTRDALRAQGEQVPA